MDKKKYIPHEWETLNCPYCNSENHTLHEKYGYELQFTYVKCSNCGLIYQSPRPKYDEKFLQDAYGQYFVFNSNYQYSPKIIAMWEKEIYEMLKYDTQKSAIIDIGSAMGDFLKAATKYYDRCVGVEVGENMAKFIEEQLPVKVYRGQFDEISFSGKYSCIHMSHVIEHVPNPTDWLTKSKAILEKDGILVISVPNMNSMDRRFKLFLKRMGLRKGDWKEDWRTPDHLFEPTINSTLRFLKDNGFRTLEYYTYSRKDMDANTFMGKIYNRKLKWGSNLRFFVTPVLD